eukprot:Blabericola_migrator_1__1868@NODE_1508_length_4389_cov_159_825544_g990_i0_p1_GENE_NODE_1508_length_4389_cov_159_825544_g990_i0NODE_1508_length_4389_cov_159_825544_g990_i0_p1_ORF_typecomplete_len812_score119_27START/PF01852_19/0_027RCP840_PscD/PF10657_9/0_014_NODE_1508_length_4389_cov_159_825544_g990_i0522487
MFVSSNERPPPRRLCQVRRVGQYQSKPLHSDAISTGRVFFPSAATTIPSERDFRDHDVKARHHHRSEERHSKQLKPVPPLAHPSHPAQPPTRPTQMRRKSPLRPQDPRLASPCVPPLPTSPPVTGTMDVSVVWTGTANRSSSGLVLPSPRVYTYSPRPTTPALVSMGSLSPDVVRRLAEKPIPDPTPRVMTLKRFPSTVHQSDIMRTPLIASLQTVPPLNLTTRHSLQSRDAGRLLSNSSAKIQSLGSYTSVVPAQTSSRPMSLSSFDSLSHRHSSDGPVVNFVQSPPFIRTPTIPEARESFDVYPFATAKTHVSTAFHTPAQDLKSVLTEKLQSYRTLYEKLIAVSEDKDCRIGDKLLQTIQSEVLSCVASMGVEPQFVLTSALSSKPVALQQPSTAIVTTLELRTAVAALPPVNDLLEETGIHFFKAFQPPEIKFTEGASQASQVEDFLKQVATGPRGGRNIVGRVIRTPRDMPVVIYGCGPVDKRYLKNYVPCVASGPNKWTARSISSNSLQILVYFVGNKAGRDQDEIDFLRDLGQFFGEVLSDWRCHRLRLFDYNAARYRSFLPTVTKLSSKELLSLGWGEMTFNGDCVSRWKVFPGGLILSFIAGVVEASVDKVMCLVYDGDTHSNWIPFISETKREFAMDRFNFVFGYGVSLPWPLNKRELKIQAMAVDAYDIDPINAIQMWGSHVPEAATSLFGVPLPPGGGKGITRMEMPILTFSLTPVGPKKTYLRMVAVMDVKINFIPVPVQNQMAKHMATKMFSNVQRICSDFDKTSYRKVMEENTNFFANLHENMNIALQAQMKAMKK